VIIEWWRRQNAPLLFVLRARARASPPHSSPCFPAALNRRLAHDASSVSSHLPAGPGRTFICRPNFMAALLSSRRLSGTKIIPKLISPIFRLIIGFARRSPAIFFDDAPLLRRGNDMKRPYRDVLVWLTDARLPFDQLSVSHANAQAAVAAMLAMYDRDNRLAVR
jgi:hypothetical protein